MFSLFPFPHCLFFPSKCDWISESVTEFKQVTFNSPRYTLLTSSWTHTLISCPRQVDGILKAVLRDEIIAWHKKTQEDTSMPLSPAGQPENMDSQQLVSLVQKAVTAIMTRLHNLAQFEGGESKVNTLVAAANSLDNLCRMDPAWHPWLWRVRSRSRSCSCSQDTRQDQRRCFLLFFFFLFFFEFKHFYERFRCSTFVRFIMRQKFFFYDSF